MTEQHDPAHHFTAEPATGRNAYYLQIIAQGMLDHELVRHLVDLIREEFHLRDPLDEDDLDHNRAHDRAAIRDRVFDAVTDTCWTDALTFVNFIFRPHETLSDFVEGLTTSADDLFDQASRDTAIATPPTQPTPDPLDALAQLLLPIATLVADEFLKRGYHDSLSDLFVDLVTDHIIEGHLSLPRPLPSWLAQFSFDLPLAGDRLLFVVLSRFADVDQAAEDLRREFRELYVTGERQTHPPNAQRDAWVMTQYLRLKDSASSESAIYSDLLHLFEATEWGHQLDRYRLDSQDADYDGALAFLRNIVRVQRDRWRALVAAVDDDPDAARDT